MTTNFDMDLEGIKLAITPRTKAIVVCSPNNPTGNMPSESEVRALLDTGILVIVDEAYYEFNGNTLLHLLDEYPNLVILRTFSKWAGLAGLRIGLGAMHPDLAGMMMSVKPPYNVNLAAEVALIASLKDMPSLLDRVNAIVDERERMIGLLNDIPPSHPTHPRQTSSSSGSRMERASGCSTTSATGVFSSGTGPVPPHRLRTYFCRPARGKRRRGLSAG